MGSVFNLKENNQYPQGDNKGLAQLAVPGGDYSSGEIDVIKTFPWTSTRLTSKAIDEVPYIKLKEYYLLDPYINQLFRAYGMGNQDLGLLATGSEAVLENFAAGRINADSRLLYQGLYDHVNETGFSYTLPYFNTTYLNTLNSWTAAPMFNQIIELVKTLAGAGAGVAGGVAGGALSLIITALTRGLGRFIGAGSAGSFIQAGGGMAARTAAKGIDYFTFFEKLTVGAQSPVASLDDPAIDKPHIWNNTAPYTYTILFTLFNTLDYAPGDVRKWNQQIIRNYELCYLLTYQNLYNKRNLFTGVPPVFYSVTIPGVYYTKAAYVSDFTILNAGNIRTMNLPVGDGGSNQVVNVPDAYVVVMTLTDFFQPSKNFMATVPTNDRGITDKSWDETLANPTVLPPQPGITPPAAPNGYLPANPSIPGSFPQPLQPCWVAREVYGITNIRWVIFRDWLYSDNGPNWLQKIYTKYGKQFATFISNKPIIKGIIKRLMDIVVNKHFK